MKTQMSYRRKWVFAPLALVFIALVCWITMLLWNSLMPAIFNLTVISFWQAAGLLLLGRLFFGGFRHNRNWAATPFNHNVRRKILAMSPEEREMFFDKMHHNRREWYKEHCERPKTEGANSSEE